MISWVVSPAQQQWKLRFIVIMVTSKSVICHPGGHREKNILGGGPYPKDLMILSYVVVWFLFTLWSKYMAQSPKGGLVGLYYPIHGDCAIYFYPGAPPSWGKIIQITYLFIRGGTSMFLFGWESLLNIWPSISSSFGMMFITSPKGHIYWAHLSPFDFSGILHTV